MLNIGNKTFMNLQEAVGWLLENNALPFQSTANYVANTEIAMSTLVNPSPAKVRVGSLIFFADSKVSTVIGVTSNSFIVSDQYNDLVDDITYVSNVENNASGHLICTLSNGTNIDAGLIKQVSGFSIDASQHLIVTYNDGSTTDLGAIFSGNVNITGSLTAGSISSPSILETSSVATYSSAPIAPFTTIVYAGAVKTGNKLTLVVFASVTPTSDIAVGAGVALGNFYLTGEVANKIYPFTVGSLTNVADCRIGGAIYGPRYSVPIQFYIIKSGTGLLFNFTPTDVKMDAGTTYLIRYEVTFLLSDNLN